MPKVERHKLDPKAWKWIMLGYGTTQKGYPLARMKVIHSRDVIFDEDSIPGIQMGFSSKYVVDKEADVEQVDVGN